MAQDGRHVRDEQLRVIVEQAIALFQATVVEVRPVQDDGLAFARRWNAMVLARKDDEG